MTALPTSIGYGRLDTLLAVLSEIQDNPGSAKPLRLDWGKVECIAPAGFAILACLFDSAIEHQRRLENVFIKKKFKALPVIRNLLEIRSFKALPKPSIQNQELADSLLAGQENALNLGFAEQLEAKFRSTLSEDLLFSCRLILNELMQNSFDHSTAERYYMHAGIWQAKGKRELHAGVLDMGVTIQSKLEQRYRADSDSDYLELAVQEGITTRRSRPGGLGLFHAFEHLKDHDGTLTIISRNAQLIRYFRNKKALRKATKHRLAGTWCMVRFPIPAEAK